MTNNVSCLYPIKSVISQQFTTTFEVRINAGARNEKFYHYQTVLYQATVAASITIIIPYMYVGYNSTSYPGPPAFSEPSISS